MKAIVIVVALACLLSVGESRQLTQSFSALVDAAKTTRVSTFVSAVQVCVIQLLLTRCAQACAPAGQLTIPQLKPVTHLDN